MHKIYVKFGSLPASFSATTVYKSKNFDNFNFTHNSEGYFLSFYDLEVEAKIAKNTPTAERINNIMLSRECMGDEAYFDTLHDRLLNVIIVERDDAAITMAILENFAERASNEKLEKYRKKLRKMLGV